MITITRKLEWDAGHRVLNHEGRCRHLHGHRYVAELTVGANALDSLGRVIDFSVLKTKVGKWIDDYWDHNLILHPQDPLVSMWQTARDHPESREAEVFGGKEPYILDCNPTAENIAAALFLVADMMLQGHGIKVFKVRIWETPNCYADYSRDSEE